jgi:hypothetical protein
MMHTSVGDTHAVGAIIVQLRFSTNGSFFRRKRVKKGKKEVLSHKKYATALGRTKSVATVVDWTRPPRPFLLKRKNLQRSPMRQLRN